MISTCFHCPSSSPSLIISPPLSLIYASGGMVSHVKGFSVRIHLMLISRYLIITTLLFADQFKALFGLLFDEKGCTALRT